MAAGYTINASCVSCGVCEDVCPRSAIVEARRQFVIRRSNCDACGICVGSRAGHSAPELTQAPDL